MAGASVRLSWLKKVLFVCIHNSARSQIAEALLNRMGDGHFEAQSAGIEPGMLNPLAVAVLSEIGIDIAAKKPRSVSELIRAGQKFDYVIMVCDAASAERSPGFPDATMLHWSLPDPAKFLGNWQERLDQTRQVRSTLEMRIKEFLCAAKP
jgi:arsenate reductase (thioredoxin)